VATAREPGTAHFGVLVEDAWQHRGLGTALVRRIAERAVEHGVGELTGTVPADAVRAVRLLRRAGLRPQAVRADGALRLSVPLHTPAATA
jgi:GNAT superfamily N-acetyltransferase